MPLTIPTLPEIVAEIRGDVEGRLPGADTRTPRSPFDVLVRVISYVHHTVLGWLVWLVRQAWPWSAEREYLDRAAAWWGVSRKPAAFAGGTVTVSGTAGAVVPLDSRMRRADGVEYIVDADAPIGSGGTGAVLVVAASAGAAGNAGAGTPVTLVSPVAGVLSAAVVGSAGLVGGADEESDEDLRGRLEARVQAPPAGGNAKDYVRWALDFPGITRAWCFPLENGAGTVTVRFAMDDVYPSDGIAIEADRLALLAWISGRAPAPADVTVGIPTAVARNYTIAVSPDTPAVRAAIEAEMRDLIRREGAPGGVLRLSREREAISRAAGETDHTLTSPTADLVCTSTQLPVLGTITWGS